MAPKRTRDVVAGTLILLSSILVFVGAFAIIGNALTGRALSLPTISLAVGLAFAVAGGLKLGDYSPPLESLLACSSGPMFMVGAGLGVRILSGKPGPSILVWGPLLLFGTLGLYFTRQLMRRRLYSRSSHAPSNNRWRGP
jgi:hypothetical protein